MNGVASKLMVATAELRAAVHQVMPQLFPHEVVVRLAPDVFERMKLMLHYEYREQLAFVGCESHDEHFEFNGVKFCKEEA